MTHLRLSVHPDLPLHITLLGATVIKKAITANSIPLCHPFYRNLSGDG